MYYRKYSCKTRVKAAGLLSVDEAMRLAGIDSMTIAPDLLRTLSKREEPQIGIANLSVFKEHPNPSEQEAKRMTFIDDETAFREIFAKSDAHKGPAKTAQVQETLVRAIYVIS